MDMKTLNLRINFFWDDGDDIWEFKLTVPSNVSEIKVADILKKEHEYLDMEDQIGSVSFQLSLLKDKVDEDMKKEWDEINR